MTTSSGSGLGLSGTLAYSPDMKCYIGSTQYGTLDISADLEEIQISRLINQVSTASLVVQNKYKKYDRRIQVMDKIVIYLKRLNWLQVFSGYVTVAPIATIVPGAIEIQAACTIKRLQDTYWDVGTFAAQALLPGILSGDPAQLGSYSDGRIVKSIANMLVKVSNWPANSIHIQGIPLAFLEQAISAASQVAEEIDQTKLQALANFVDTSSMTNGQYSADTTNFNGSPAVGVQNQEYTPNFGNNSIWRVGTIGTNDHLTFNSSDLTLGQYESNKGFIPYICTGPFQGPSGAIDAGNYWSQQELMLINSNNAKKGVVVIPTGYVKTNTINITPEVMKDLGVNAGDSIEVAFVDPSVKYGKYTNGSSITAALQATQQYSNIGQVPTTTGNQNQANAIVAAAKSALGTPYVWGDGHGGAGGVGIGFDCSGLADFCLNKAGINSGTDTAEQLFELGPYMPANVNPQPGDLVFFSKTPYSPASSNALTLSISNLVWVAMEYGGLTRENANIAAGIAGGPESGGNIVATNYNTNGTYDRGLWQINTIHSSNTNASVYTIEGNAQAMASVYSSQGWFGPTGGWGSDNTSSSYTQAFNAAVSCVPSAPTINVSTCYIPTACSNQSPLNLTNLQSHGGAFPSTAINANTATTSSTGSTTTQAEHVEIFVGTNPNASGNNWMIGADTSGTNVRFDQLLTYTVGQVCWGGLYYMGCTRPAAGVAQGANDIFGITSNGSNNTITVDPSNGQNVIQTDPNNPATAFGLPSNFNLSNEFNVLFTVPAWDPRAQYFYGSDRAFITDDTLLNAVMQVTAASLRHFQSAPNGDFVSWFPDYFGLYGQTPALEIRNIEISDFKVYRNDDQITTHVGVSGDSLGLGQSVSIADWMVSSGIVTIQQSAIMQMLWRTSYTAAEFNAQAFLNKYGLRPYVTEIPVIRNHFLEFTFALLTFMEKWADQYNSTVSTTFMPEVYPGMRISLPDEQMEFYVEGVTHTCSRILGFTTEMNITAPTKNGHVLELTSAEPLNPNVKVVSGP